MKLLIAFVLSCSLSPLFGQDAVTTYTTSKVRIVNHGEKMQLNSIQPCEITLNLQDSTITITSDLPEVGSFLGGKSVFAIEDILGVNTSVQAFIVENDFVVSFNYQFNSIYVSKRRMNIQLHSIEFREAFQ